MPGIPFAIRRPGAGGALVVVVALAALAGPVQAQGGSDQLQLGALSLRATARSIGAVLAVSGDADGDARAWLEVRAEGEVDYHRGQAMVRLAGGRFAGSLLFLTADTPYQVQAVVEDPDNGGPVAAAGAARTRAETPQPLPDGRDWVVDAVAGSDTNPGTAAAPFRTIQRGASAAQAGDRVRVRPGIYREKVTPPRGGRPDALLWIQAEGEGVVIDGSHAGLSDHPVWTQDQGALYWTPFTGTCRYLAVDDTRVYDYASLAALRAEHGNIAQPGVFPGGYFVDATARRLYLITPGHDHPAGHVVHAGILGPAFMVNVSDLVISGFEIRYFGKPGLSIGVDLHGARCWVLDNRFHHLNTAVRISGIGAVDNVVAGNSFRDTSVYGWPWASVKDHTPGADGIQVRGGGGNVVRDNRIEGSFNGIKVGNFSESDDEATEPDCDVHDNFLRQHLDDGLELEGALRNVRTWGNEVRESSRAVSLAPVGVGPLYLVRNLLLDATDMAFKVNNNTRGFVFLYHTTVRPPDGNLHPEAQGLEPSVPFGNIVTRNNIFEANRYVIEYEPTTLAAPVDWDHDALWTHDSVPGTPCAGAPAPRFVKWLNVCYPDLAALIASGTIESHALQVEPGYEDAAGGDFTLLAGHPLLDRGVVLDGVNDGAIHGEGPDLGAVERGLAAAANLRVGSLVAPARGGAGLALPVDDATGNAGAAPAAASRTHLYLSADVQADGSDALVGGRDVPELAAGAVSAGASTATLPAGLSPGRWFLIARADGLGALAEGNEGDNVLVRPLAVGPDLVLTALGAAPLGGAARPLPITDTTANPGGGNADASTTRFYLSADTVLDPADALLGGRTVPALAVDGVSSGLTAPPLPGDTTTGRWYVLAAADGPGLVAEANETNNVAAVAAAVTVGPDLVVSALTAPATGGAGRPLNVQDTTQDIGGGDAPAAALKLYLSRDTRLDAADRPIPGRTVPALVPGGSSPGVSPATLPADTATGNWFVLAEADGERQVSETSETNNLRASKVVKVGPDLQVSVLTAPASVTRGVGFTATDTTRNAGGGDAAPSSTWFYLSRNNALDAGDVLLGSRGVPLLAPLGTHAAGTPLVVPPETALGAYYLIAAADRPGTVSETVETNNLRSKALTVR